MERCGAPDENESPSHDSSQEDGLHATVREDNVRKIAEPQFEVYPRKPGRSGITLFTSELPLTSSPSTSTIARSRSLETAESSSSRVLSSEPDTEAETSISHSVIPPAHWKEALLASSNSAAREEASSELLGGDGSTNPPPGIQVPSSMSLIQAEPEPSQAPFNPREDLDVPPLPPPHEETFKCSQCGRIFLQADDMKRHECVHERPDDQSSSHTHPETGTSILPSAHTSAHSESHQEDSSVPEEVPLEFLRNSKSVHSPSAIQAFTSDTLTGLRPLLSSSALQIAPLDLSQRPNSSIPPSVIQHWKYKCEICGRCFTRKCSLIAHQASHTDKEPYRCMEVADCHNQFRTKRALKRHIMHMHSGRRVYKCEEPGCDEGFLQNSGLLRHVREVHRNERPFECPHCNLRFQRMALLRRHKRSHLKNQSSQEHSQSHTLDLVQPMPTETGAQSINTPGEAQQDHEDESSRSRVRDTSSKTESEESYEET